MTPAGATPWVPPRTRIDSTLVKAIVRAHRWRDMLESGDYAAVRDLAKAEANPVTSRLGGEFTSFSPIKPRPLDCRRPVLEALVMPS